MFKFLAWFGFKDIPPGVRVLTYATAVRWAGWGLAESLIPVMLFSFSQTYAEAGLLRSAYDLTFILALPIAGLAADRFLSTTLILGALVLYVFIGLGYYLAGLTGLVFLVVAARLLNGVAYAMDSMGREAYFRRYTPKRQLATIFGYFDTIANFWWVVAALAGIVLLRYFSVPLLLLMITPTSLLAGLIVWQFRRQEKQQSFDVSGTKLRSAYGEAFKEIWHWDWKLKSLAMFNFFRSFAWAAVGFFLPIQVYSESHDYTKTILVSVAFTLPYLLGWVLGKLFDNKGSATFLYSLAVLALLFGGLSVFDFYLWQMATAFGIGIIMELLAVGSSELITVNTRPEHFGRVGGIMESIRDLGMLASPLVLGVLIDIRGMSYAFGCLAVLFAVLTLVFYVMKKFEFMPVIVAVQNREDYVAAKPVKKPFIF